MPIATETAERLLITAARLEIEAAELARALAPARTHAEAEFAQARERATQNMLRRALMLGDTEVARAPLRAIAAHLGVPLDEGCDDYRVLARNMVRVLFHVSEERARREAGVYDGPTRFFRAGLKGCDAASPLPRPVARLEASPEAGAPPAAASNLLLAADTAPPAPVQAIADTPAAAVSRLALPATAAPSDRCAITAAAAVSVAPARAAPAPAAPVPAQVAPPAAAATAPQAPALEAAVPPPGPGLRSLTISAAAAAYIGERSDGKRTFKSTETRKAAKGESWQKNSAANVTGTGRLMVKLLGDRDLRQISSQDLTAAFETMQRVPATHGKSRSDTRTIFQVVEDTDRMETENIAMTIKRMQKKGETPGNIEARVAQERIPRMRAATLYRHMQDFQRICVYAMRTGALETNIMFDHIWDSETLAEVELHQQDNKREVWTSERIAKLFRSPIYQEKLDEPGDPFFWAPLIALHAGMRCEEILQLNVDDIRDCGGVLCFVLRQGGGQSLKSFAARRTIPVHPNLIELGLGELLAQRRRNGQVRLFPWLARSKNKSTFTENFSKTFTKYRKDNAIYWDNCDFHSFRTTFNVALIRTECLDTQRRYLMGHVESDVGIKNYNPDGFSEILTQKRVAAVEVNISMVRKPFGDRPAGEVTHLGDRRISVVK